MTKIILVTGCCGFIGSGWVNYYHKLNPDDFIINIDKLDYCSNEKNIINRIHNYKFIKCNLTNTEFILHILNEFNVTHVIHFAAQTHVDNSFCNSINFTIDNVVGTHSLLEAIKTYNKIKKFIHISTDEVFGEVDISHKGCTETSLLAPTNPYAATKCGAEFLVRSYHHSFKLPSVIVRINNVYGERQYPEKLIPKFIKLLRENKKCTIHGTGQTRRNFIHVNDVANAITLVLDKGDINMIYNIGTKNEFSVLEITEKILKILKPNEKLEEWIEYIEDRNFNDYRYAIDNTLLKILGWNEDINFEIGLQNTVKWYLENLD